MIKSNKVKIVSSVLTFSLAISLLSCSNDVNKAMVSTPELTKTNKEVFFDLKGTINGVKTGKSISIKIAQPFNVKLNPVTPAITDNVEFH